MISKLLSGTGLRAQLLSGGVGSAGVIAAGKALSFAVVLVLAHVLGPDGYGVYSYIFSIVGLMTVAVQFGLPTLVTRETTKAEAKADWASLKGIWLWAVIVTGGTALLLAVLGELTAWLLADQFVSTYFATFVWGLALVPALVLAQLLHAALQGLRHVVASQLPELVLRPGLLVIFILTATVLNIGGPISPSEVMALHVLAACLAVVTGAILLHRFRPKNLRSVCARFQHRAWTLALVPLGLTAGMMLINQQVDILILGLFVDPGRVGIYRVAVQGALIVPFGLQAVNMVIAPHITRLHSRKEHRQLQRLCTGSSRAALVIALPVTLVYLLAGQKILSLVMGPSFASGAAPLAILAIGQMVNVGMGSVGLLLNMTDNQTVVARTVTLVAMFNVIANFLLIPFWGMNGAATATATTLIIWNGMLARVVYNRLGVNSTVLGPRENLT